MPSRCFLMVMASRLNGASRSVWSSHRGIQQRADLRDIRAIGEHRAQRLLESEAACGPRVSALQPVHLVDLLACQLFGALGCASADAAQLGAVLTSARRAWSSAASAVGGTDWRQPHRVCPLAVDSYACDPRAHASHIRAAAPAPPLSWLTRGHRHMHGTVDPRLSGR